MYPLKTLRRNGKRSHRYTIVPALIGIGHVTNERPSDDSIGGIVGELSWKERAPADCDGSYHRR